MVCARRLRKVVLTIVGTVILWTREKRGHWSRSNARRDTKECNANSPALRILAAYRKNAAVPKATCDELVAFVLPWFLLFFQKASAKVAWYCVVDIPIQNIPCGGSSVAK